MSASTAHGDGAASLSGRPRTLLATTASPLMVAVLWSFAALLGRVWEPLEPAAVSLGRLGTTVLVVLAINAIHEAGHIVAGLLVGTPFTRFTLGILTVVYARGRQGPRLRAELNRAWMKFAGCVEREVTPGPRTRMTLTVTALGGPLASVVAGVLLWPEPFPWRPIGLISILVGFLNALPITSFGQMSDGMIVWRLWSRRPEDVAWRARWAEPEPPLVERRPSLLPTSTP